jgi:hypothetical protein
LYALSPLFKRGNKAWALVVISTHYHRGDEKLVVYICVSIELRKFLPCYPSLYTNAKPEFIVRNPVASIASFLLFFEILPLSLSHPASSLGTSHPALFYP